MVTQCSCDCGDGAHFNSLQDYVDTFTDIENTCINDGHPGESDYVPSGWHWWLNWYRGAGAGSNMYDPGAGQATISCTLT